MTDEEFEKLEATLEELGTKKGMEILQSLIKKCQHLILNQDERLLFSWFKEQSRRQYKELTGEDYEA